MAIHITEELKAQVILSAVITAGPDADDTAVGNQIARILGYFEDGSSAMSAFTRAEKRAEKTVKTVPIVGVIVHVDKELTSNRPIIFLKTEITDKSPAGSTGFEFLRLDRLDGPDAERSRQLAKTAQALRGHNVLAQKAIESGNGQNNRVLRGLEDRGVVEGFDLGNTNWQVPWNNHAFANLVPKLQSFQSQA